MSPNIRWFEKLFYKFINVKKPVKGSNIEMFRVRNISCDQVVSHSCFLWNHADFTCESTHTPVHVVISPVNGNTCGVVQKLYTRQSMAIQIGYNNYITLAIQWQNLWTTVTLHAPVDVNTYGVELTLYTCQSMAIQIGYNNYFFTRHTMAIPMDDNYFYTCQSMSIPMV
jgi:hypothetical protein